MDELHRGQNGIFTACAHYGKPNAFTAACNGRAKPRVFFAPIHEYAMLKSLTQADIDSIIAACAPDEPVSNGESHARLPNYLRDGLRKLSAETN